jgi:DNA-binding PadR family transcriptional regulator
MTAPPVNGPTAGAARTPLRSAALALLAEEHQHGYELWWRLSARGYTASRTPGGVHRALRALEDESLVASEWQSGDYGPARRVYHITAKGRRALRDLPPL